MRANEDKSPQPRRAHEPGHRVEEPIRRGAPDRSRVDQRRDGAGERYPEGVLFVFHLMSDTPAD